ncbi:hypothetical protein SVIRM249S_01851 [Streptomyces viridochromogenes]
MSRDHQQPSPTAPLVIWLDPDTVMTLRFIAEPTGRRRRHRRSLQPPHHPTGSGLREAPAGSRYPSV